MKVMHKGVEREVVYWDCEDGVENLLFTNISEAVAFAYDRSRHEERHAPKTVTVYGYARIPAPQDPLLADRVVRWLLSEIDDTYRPVTGHNAEIECGQNFREPPTKPRAAQTAAARVFVNAVLADYVPWGCEVVVERTVNVADAIAGKYDEE